MSKKYYFIVKGLISSNQLLFLSKLQAWLSLLIYLGGGKSGQQRAMHRWIAGSWEIRNRKCHRK